MVQVIQEQRRPSTAELFGRAFSNMGQVAAQAIPEYLQGKEMRSRREEENKSIKNTLGIDLSNIHDEKLRAQIVGETLKGLQKSNLLKEKINLIRGEGRESLESSSGQPKSPSSGRSLSMSPEQMDILALVDPQAASYMQKKEKEARQTFESDRSYHTQFSKKAEDEAHELRRSLPKKEMAISFAKDAVLSGDLNYFSPDKLADATGIDLFRTSKGSALLTAGKENLLSNMSRASARAQNMWFEQRLNSMFPKIGQSQEANETILEMLEAEQKMDQLYLSAFDKIVSEDQENLGYVRKDVAERAQKEVDAQQKDILKASSFRMKQIQEREEGLSSLKQKVGKKVPKGTPLTPMMMTLYVKKFGEDKAIQIAEKNGYVVPTIEEYQNWSGQ